MLARIVRFRGHGSTAHLPVPPNNADFDSPPLRVAAEDSSYTLIREKIGQCGFPDAVASAPTETCAQEASLWTPPAEDTRGVCLSSRRSSGAGRRCVLRQLGGSACVCRGRGARLIRMGWRRTAGLLAAGVALTRGPFREVAMADQGDAHCSNRGRVNGRLQTPIYPPGFLRRQSANGPCRGRRGGSRRPGAATRSRRSVRPAAPSRHAGRRPGTYRFVQP